MLFGVLAWATMRPSLLAQPTALTPHIVVLPDTTVRVGEEVLFDATGTTCDSVTCDDPDMLSKGRYEWDFGDDYVAKFGDPYYYSAESGIAVVHFYMRPGVYTAALTVSVWREFGGDDLPIGDPVAVATATTQITVMGQPPRLPPWPDENTVLDMALDGDLTDSSPNGLAATWQGGSGGFGAGWLGQSADLTGGAYISVTDPSGVLDGVDELTISFWAKKDSADAYGYLIDKPGQFNMWIGAGFLRVTLTTSGGATWTTAWSAYEVDNTHWHHYAATYDGTTLRLFIDGRELASEAHSGTVASSTDSLLIGRRSTSSDVFNGYIDKVQIYDKALSLSDIFVGFELWHAPYHTRIAQYIYAQIPSAVYVGETNRLRVTVSGDSGYNGTVFESTEPLTAEVKFLLRNADLPTGNYTLTAQLLDSGDQVLDEIHEWLASPTTARPRWG